MALTKEQIAARILPGQLVKRRKNIVWGDIVSAVASASNTQKAAIAEKLRNREYAAIGKLLSEIVMASILAEVQLDINNKLANNSLNLDELSEILT